MMVALKRAILSSAIGMKTTDTFSIANEEGVLFNFTTFLVLYMVLAYGIGAPYLYLHMFQQRSKQLGGGEKLKVQ